jgi:hypothetical protein
MDETEKQKIRDKALLDACHGAQDACRIALLAFVVAILAFVVALVVAFT